MCGYNKNLIKIEPNKGVHYFILCFSQLQEVLLENQIMIELIVL